MAGLCDPSVLILAVKKHPILWDSSSESYFNRELKDAAWEMVCLETCEDYDSFQIEDKLKYVYELRKKWANIRDCYRRDLHRLKSLPMGSSSNNIKRYTYSDILPFLEPVFKNKCPGENGCQGNAGNILDRKNRKTVMIRRRTARKQGIHNVEVTGPFKVEKKQEAKEEKERDEFEDDTKFLLSLRSYMKGIDNSQKLQLKIEMLQLVQKFRNQREATQSSPVFEWSSYPYPSTTGANIAFNAANVTHNNGVITNSRVVPSNAFLPTLIIQPASATHSNSSLMAAKNSTQTQPASDPDLEIVKSEI